MSGFVAFCRSLGILLDETPPVGRWVRVPTEAHPRKKNGAVKFLGTHGFAQEHSTMTDVAVWKADGDSSVPAIDQRALKEAEERERRRIAEGRAKAAERAAMILAQCRQDQHAYLAAKGFPEAQGLVWERDGQRLLVVPMRVDGRLVGCQLIDEAGGKKFLPGQLTRNATFVIGRGEPLYCEGYATALSAHKALQFSRLPGSVVACFSAHNLVLMATSGIVLADNDASRTGELAAQRTGRPYWMSPIVGEDFNDYALRLGGFKASQALKLTLMQTRAKARAA